MNTTGFPKVGLKNPGQSHFGLAWPPANAGLVSGGISTEVQGINFVGYTGVEGGRPRL